MAFRSNPAMRHCMVVFAPYPLGETRVQREAEVLLKNGFEVDVICLRLPGEPSSDVYKGVNIYRQKYRLIDFMKGGSLSDKFFKYIRFFFSASFRVTQLYFKKKYSCIQVHNLPDYLVFCAMIPKLLGVPVILDLHELMPELYASHFGIDKSLIARLILFEERLACRFADHLITVSELCKQALIQRSVPEEKCSIVMNVADESIFHPSVQARYIPHNHKSFRLIYHGSFVERNGIDLAIQAVDRVRNDIPDIHLSLIGRGKYLPQMKHLIDKLDLNKYVLIEDLHVAEDLPKIIMSCDLGVVPVQSDVFTDIALPTKLMEYAALGLPAIASRTRANQAYFSDSNTEFFEPGNADDLARCILMLYHNPDRMAELARRSQNFTQRYNWTNIGAEYVALVKRLGSKRGLSDKVQVHQNPRNTN
jgi:glycosyltransferase involved in cell wall biosynthesis